MEGALTGARTLALAQTQGYANSVTGFSNASATTLDLGDTGEATFSATVTGGTLTVPDRTRTADTPLKGNYLNSIVASSDGHDRLWPAALGTSLSPDRPIQPTGPMLEDAAHSKQRRNIKMQSDGSHVSYDYHKT